MKQAYHVILVFILTIIGLVCVYTLLDNTNCVKHSYSHENNNKITTKVKSSLMNLFKRFKFNTKTQSWKCSSTSKMASNISKRVSKILYTMYPNYEEISTEIEELGSTMKKIQPSKKISVSDFSNSMCVKMGIMSAMVSAAVAEECTCLFDTLTAVINSLEQTQMTSVKPANELDDNKSNEKKTNKKHLSNHFAHTSLVPKNLNHKNLYNDKPIGFSFNK